MPRRSLILALLILVGCGETPALQPALDLPTVTTLWRGRLPDGPRIEVSIDRDGTVTYGDRVRQPAFRIGHPFVDPEHDADQTQADRAWIAYREWVEAEVEYVARNPDGSCPTPILIRTDAAVPWGQTMRVMLAGAHPNVQCYRMFFAATQAGEEGVVPWLLPRDHSGGLEEQPTRLTFHLFRRERQTSEAYTLVRLDRDVEFRLSSDPEARALAFTRLHAAIRERLAWFGERRAGATASINTPPPKGPHVPTGDVVALLGLLLSENVYADLTAAAVESDLGYRADGSIPEDVDGSPDEAFHWAYLPEPGIGHARVHEPPNPSEPVAEALRWLAAHQSEDGSWTAHGADGGREVYDVGVSGLALSAFLAAGYTNRGKHPFQRTVSIGLRYLKNVQDPDGCFGTRATPTWIYNHAAASLAMLQAYGTTRSPIFKGAAIRALGFIAQCRNPGGVWRYGLRPGDNDTSVTGWMLLPLLAARDVNDDLKQQERAPVFEIDEAGFSDASAWLDLVTDPVTGRVGYIMRSSGLSRTTAQLARWPLARSEALTALGLLLRLRLSDRQRNDRMRTLILAQAPGFANDAEIDMVFWRFAAEALASSEDDGARAWLEQLRAVVTENQVLAGTNAERKGSWDPRGPWGADGGRVYATAMLALCLNAIER